MIALDICNAYQAFDIEGAQSKMDELKLEHYPVEDVTEYAAFAQKQSKVIQNGYAPPFHSGSNIFSSYVTRNSNNSTGKHIQC
jgi:hypothetical protein